ncbi:MAG: hypothetical protein J0M17_06835 [Planctomycetes bacterium]|nr:hypothetical protein [Planctomycetota bacterium]
MDEVAEIAGTWDALIARPEHQVIARFASRAFAAMTIVLVKRSNTERVFLTVAELTELWQILQSESEGAAELLHAKDRADDNFAELVLTTDRLLDAVFTTPEFHGMREKTALQVGELAADIELIVGDIDAVILKTLEMLVETADGTSSTEPTSHRTWS